MSFTAQYHGECADCGGELKGQESHYNADGEVQHVRCPVDMTTAAIHRNERSCGLCFQIHAGDCA